MVACLPGTLEEQSIKVLDLLTNRYHVGIVRAASHGGMHIELAAGGSGHFQAGQRVHFALADQPLIMRQSMRRAFITRVSSTDEMGVRLQLALLPETAVA